MKKEFIEFTNIIPKFKSIIEKLTHEINYDSNQATDDFMVDLYSEGLEKTHVNLANIKETFNELFIMIKESYKYGMPEQDIEELTSYFIVISGLLQIEMDSDVEETETLNVKIEQEH